MIEWGQDDLTEPRKGRIVMRPEYIASSEMFFQTPAIAHQFSLFDSVRLPKDVRGVTVFFSDGFDHRVIGITFHTAKFALKAGPCAGLSRFVPIHGPDEYIQAIESVNRNRTLFVSRCPVISRL